MNIDSGETKKTFTDVYIGDVWVASGQSNLELTVSQANDAKAQIAVANSQLNSTSRRILTTGFTRRDEYLALRA